jgi:hypothetical protein
MFWVDEVKLCYNDKLFWQLYIKNLVQSNQYLKKQDQIIPPAQGEI